MLSDETKPGKFLRDAISKDLKEGSLGRVGELAVERGYITPQQLEEALREQLESEGKLQIGQILLRRNDITSEQFVELLGAHNRYLLLCKGCGKKYQILGFKGQMLWCLGCGQELVLANSPEDLVHSPDQFQTPYRPTVREDRPGLWIGRYQIVREVARGGMGIVFEAMDPELKRKVALKILKEGEADLDSVKRLHREAAVAGKLKHPNIVMVHEVGVADDTHYIAMDFIEGPTLAKRIEEKGAGLPVRDVVAILKHVAEAVAYAHSQRVIHRDLKPSNIMLDPERGPIVTDFGLAKELVGATVLTAAGSLLGTPQYMSPEQVDGKEAGPEADVYALGVILYEALTGRRPFEGATLIELQRSIMNNEPIHPGKLRREIDADLETICLKCMGKLPQWRYASARELFNDLDMYLKGESIQARPVGLHTRIVRKIRRNWRFSAAIGAAVLTALIGLGIGVSEIYKRLTQKAVREKIAPWFQQAQWIHEQFLEELRTEPHDIRPSRKKLKEAFSLLEDCIARDPQYSEARLLKGQICEDLEDVDSALGEYRAVIRAEPTFLKAYVAKIAAGAKKCGKMTNRSVSQEDPQYVPEAVRSAFARELLADVRTALKLGADSIVQEYCETALECFGNSGNPDDDVSPLLERCDRNIREGRMVQEFLLLALATIQIQVERTDKDVSKRMDLILKAIEWIERVRRHAPMRLDSYRDAHKWYKQGEMILPPERRQSHPEAMFRLVDEWLRIEPEYVEGYVMRAQCHQGMGRFDEAERDYAMAIQLNPTSVVPFSARASMYVDHYRTLDPTGEKADRDLAETLQRNPDDWSIYHTRYRLRFRRGQYAEAFEDISRAIDIWAKITYVGKGKTFQWQQGYVLRARVLNRMEQYDRAIEDATVVVDLNGELEAPMAYEERAYAYWMKQEFEPALADCDRLLQDNPASWMGRLVRGNIYLHQKKFTEALEDADLFQQVAPNSLDARTLRANALQGLNRLDEAAAELEAILDMLPEGHPMRLTIEQQVQQMRMSTPAPVTPGPY